METLENHGKKIGNVRSDDAHVTCRVPSQTIMLYGILLVTFYFFLMILKWFLHHDIQYF